MAPTLGRRHDVTGTIADSPSESGAGKGVRSPSSPPQRYDRRTRGSSSIPPGHEKPLSLVTSTKSPRTSPSYMRRSGSSSRSEPEPVTAGPAESAFGRRRAKRSGR